MIKSIHLTIIVIIIIVIILGGGRRHTGHLGLEEMIELSDGETVVGNGAMQCGIGPHIEPTISRMAHAQATPPSRRDVCARGQVCRAWQQGKNPCG